MDSFVDLGKYCSPEKVHSQRATAHSTKHSLPLHVKMLRAGADHLVIGAILLVPKPG
jgi:hypothetical protein